MLYIPRDITPVLQKIASQFPILFLTGPRQSGKSTLLRHVFSSYQYVSLEEPDIRAMALDDPRGFLALFKAPLIIDEAQRAPELFSYLQSQVDQDRKPGSYILSGSQNFLMLRNISQSLAGRAGIATLLPFSLPEIQQIDWPYQNTDDWLYFGAYPQIIAERTDSNLYFESYTKTYVERDIALGTGIHDLTRFRNFMIACATRVGNLINFSGLARDVSVNVATAQSWLSILEESYVCFRLMPYYNNYGKRYTKTPKLYFYDTGLLCSLLGFESSTELSQHELRGHIFENAVIAEYHKQRLHQNKQPRAYFWRDVHGDNKEIDLVANFPEGLALFEIKSAQTANPKFTSTIKSYVANNATPGSKPYVIYDGINGLVVNEAQFINWRNFRVPG